VKRRVFEQRLSDLVLLPVEDLDSASRATLLRRYADTLESLGANERFSASFVPFVPGRRPRDESSYPGLGSSEEVALYNAVRSPEDRLVFLVRCQNGDTPVAGFPEGTDVLGTIELLDLQGQPMGTVAGWDRRDLRPLLHPMSTTSHSVIPAAQELALEVETTFAPEAMPVARDAYLGFGQLFHQRFRILLDVEAQGARLTGGVHAFEIYNEAEFGALYQRLLEVLLPWDIGRQFEEGAPPVSAHPWYPVLSIGMQKARFYMQAVLGDLVEQKQLLTDPGWLLRVGLYLELLTCLGVAEAVRDDIDLLSADERSAFETASEFEEIRRRIDPAAWKKVWALREVAEGPLNLMRKKATTLVFLHTHHEDLKHAIELAGPNLHNAQETWHRVFRDAERAVLAMNEDAFPELALLPETVHSFALWHRTGSIAGLQVLPAAVTELFGDQDGIFPAACRQYRDSMNHIADWARRHGWMEYTGDECVPLSASLLDAYLDQQLGRLAALQRGDGFAGTLQIRSQEPPPVVYSEQTFVDLLRRGELLSVLTVDEIQRLVQGVRPIQLAHHERIIVQGKAGSSVFVLQEGTLEVLRRERGADRQVALLHAPSVVGERSFLLGERRSATVRAIDSAIVLEVGASLLRPLVERRPAILERLRSVLETRERTERGTMTPEALLTRLRRNILGVA
jgi:CRP-like cAMP-binding protein